MLMAATSRAAAQQTAQGAAPPPQAAAPPQAPAPPPVRAYRPNLADEDWSFLADRSLRKDRFDPVKYISLFGGRSYLTFGGEARIRPEGLRVRPAPDGTSTVDNYVFQRYLFATDWHIGARVRVFGELQSGILNGKLASPRPTDENVADVHQAFVEYHSPKGHPRQFTLRLGRQEMTIGSSRLISASQGLNVKRSFDGLVTVLRTGAWTVEGGAARLVRVGGGAFDDTSTTEQQFWGAALARRGLFFKGGAGGIYYLGVDRALSRYAQGFGPETRHTIGGKFTGVWAWFDINYDLIGQWGSFADEPVRAWAVSLDHSVRVSQWPWRPRFTLRFNSASGDRDPSDPRLQSFNPLFPGSAYSGAVGLLGPTNLTDLTPAIQLQAPHRLVLIFEAPTYFRTSLRDAIYNIELRPLIYNASIRERYVGANPGVVAIWQATPHLSLTGVITRFLPGAYVKGSFVQYGFGFYSSSITYRF
jgi:Alginate export